MSGLTLNITIPNSLGHFQPGENNGLSTGNNTNSSQGQQPFDQQTIEQMAQLLAELLKPLLSSQSGDSSSDANGTSPLSGLSNIGGTNGASGNSLLSGLGGAGGLSGQNGSVSGISQDDSQSALNDMSSNGLDQSLSSDGQGGGNISDNPLLKALLKLIAQMMDGLNGQFGQPDGSDDSSSSGGGTSGGMARVEDRAAALLLAVLHLPMALAGVLLSAADSPPAPHRFPAVRVALRCFPAILR